MRSVTTLLVLVVLSCVAVQTASAQAEATLRGVVRDANSGAPIAGALLSIEDRQAISSTDGTFRFVRLPAGRRRLHVEAFGFRPLEENVSVSVGMAPIELRLEPDPIQLRELTVTGNARSALNGVVLNARSGEPIQWADLTLTRGATRAVGRREASSQQGVFSIANIAPGDYLLRAERIGFVSVYVPVSHSVPPLPVEVRLEPDPAVLRGLAVMNGELANRRQANGRSVRAFNEQALRTSRAAGMRHFIEAFTSVILVECVAPRGVLEREVEHLSGLIQRRNCIRSRGTTTRPLVFIDEILVFDPAPLRPMRSRRAPGQPPPPPPPPPEPPISMDILDTYDPRDFHSFEYFECASGRVELRVYTYQFMDQMARRPRVPMLACFP
jgi:hypothetical protein